jgi:hypothetical protein
LTQFCIQFSPILHPILHPIFLRRKLAQKLAHKKNNWRTTLAHKKTKLAHKICAEIGAKIAPMLLCWQAPVARWR